MINGGTSTAPSAPSGIHATVYKISFPVVAAYAIRHVAAVVSMAKVAISFPHIIKGRELAFSVLVSTFLLDQTFLLPVYMSLVPMILVVLLLL
ncbi:hypothetical protein WN944_014786 [Citrus x changshan-huyou]|uniref:Sugar phosphate transporter domain-containing protein n=1 Tax=Citrus x changshan-huyou TaxID=2935761 RepID=A0AAP0M450_9ROSI